MYDYISCLVGMHLQNKCKLIHQNSHLTLPLITKGKVEKMRSWTFFFCVGIERIQYLKIYNTYTCYLSVREVNEKQFEKWKENEIKGIVVKVNAPRATLFVSTVYTLYSPSIYSHSTHHLFQFLLIYYRSTRSWKVSGGTILAKFNLSDFYWKFEFDFDYICRDLLKIQHCTGL